MPGGTTPAASAALTDRHEGEWIVARLLLLVFICCLVYAVWAASIGWHNTLNDRHSFRQSQTAMTARYMVDKPFRLAYETPVLGKPWAIPLEFPLYQWIVARIVGLCGTPVDQTGRFVSLTFFLLSTIPIYRLTRSAGVAPGLAWLPVILFVISPFYIFWGRTVMIELAAMFFGMCYLSATTEARRSETWIPWGLAVTCGSLAALVKITTFGGYIVPCGLVAVFEAWRSWRTMSPQGVRLRRALVWLAVPTIPLSVGVAWAGFAASVRAQNPFTGRYLTGAAADGWVYGTWTQKFSWQVWSVITDRFVELIGYPPLAWLLLGVTLAITLVTPRRWKETTGCFCCYLIAPAIFTNVHFVHDYYMNANGVFLIMAMGFAITGLFEESRTRKAAVALLAIAIFAAVAGHRVMHLPRQKLDNSEILRAAEYIQAATPEDSVIVCVGFDWSALVPYYARRRAVMIPMHEGMDGTLVDKSLANLRGETVSAIVVIEPTLYPLDRAKQQVKDAGFDVPVLTLKGLPFR